MEQKVVKGFASDNNSGVHPDVLEAMTRVNIGHAVAYGDDIFTRSTLQKFKTVFGENADIYFIFNGTGANVTGLQAVTCSFNAVICAETAHINMDECGAPEKFTGCKLVTIATENGKIRPEQIKSHLHGFGFEHHVQPKVISITQATELGTVYTPDEIRDISDLAHNHNMIVHMDGARIANAAASLNLGLRAVSLDAGVDILSFGGTKNGMMYGEALVFADKKMSGDYKYIRKQGMQLASKMRFIAAQFDALLSNDLWLKNARHSNQMAKLLADEAAGIPGVEITQKVESNGVFAIIPEEYVAELQKESFFYVWDEERSEVRWMTSFDTTEEDIINFIKVLKKIIK